MTCEAIPGEEWRDVPGWEGIYQISNTGRLKSFKEYPAGKILKLTNRHGDYFRVVLQKVGRKSLSTSVHRLVAALFVPNPNGFPVVNHIDGNKQNNNAANLEWCTASHNVRHAVSMHPEMVSGMVEYNTVQRPKRIVQLSKDGQVVALFSSAAMAQRKTGICRRNILQVANRTPYRKGRIRKTAGGYIWRFESEVMPREV